MRVLILLLLASGCVAPPPGPAPTVPTLDGIRDEATEKAVVSFGEKDSTNVRERLKSSQVYWSSDPTYQEVRRRVGELPAIERIVRLEIGRAHGGRYTSTWFVDTERGVIEFGTGLGVAGVQERAVSDSEWTTLTRSLAGCDRVTSNVALVVSDAPVYFFCAEGEGVRCGFVLEAWPEPSESFDLVNRTLILSAYLDPPVGFRQLGVSPP
jgi:hypothetical protein